MDQVQPNPNAVATLLDLAHEFGRLRRSAAGKGQVQLSIRELAARTGRAPSTLDPYLRGVRLCPVDTYEELLRALGVPNEQLRPWLDAWERVADGLEVGAVRGRRTAASGPSAVGQAREAQVRARPLTRTEVLRYRVIDPGARPDTRVCIVTGDLRRVRCAEAWVNSENTNMLMARFEDYSVSAIIRYEGARRDEAGMVLEDCLADELTAKLVGRRPVVPGAAITTGAGALRERNGVRYVIHVASVHGEPGEGYRQVADVARCVSNALAEAERLGDDDQPVRSVLFPLLGVGTGGGPVEPTVAAMLGATVDHLTDPRHTRVEAVYFLAFTDQELAVCTEVFAANASLRRLADRFAEPIGFE